MTDCTCPECGAVFDLKTKGKARSYPQLKRFHAVIKAAFHHWPTEHRFKPKNQDHLRAWLEVEAGHFEVVKTIRCETVEASHLTALLTAIMRSCDDDKIFVEAEGNVVTVKRALSISYAMLAHLSACALFDQIDHVIKTEIGIDTDTLLKETEKAA